MKNIQHSTFNAQHPSPAQTQVRWVLNVSLFP